SGPAQIDGGSDIVLRPLHNLLEFFPVVHFLELHLLHRRPCDDHSVESAVFQRTESLIEFIQMAHGSILGLMALHSHKSNIHLKRCVGERPQKRSEERRVGKECRDKGAREKTKEGWMRA